MKFVITIEDVPGGGFRRKLERYQNGVADDVSSNAQAAASVGYNVLGVLGHADVAAPIIHHIGEGIRECDKRLAIKRGGTLVSPQDLRRDH